MTSCPTRSRGERYARRALLLSPFLLAASAGLWVPVGASASTPAVTAVAAASAGRALLPQSLHPWARPDADVGRMDPARHLTGMSVLFKPSAAQKALEGKTLAALENPTSPSYHQWLTPEQYAAHFGASPADVARTSAWLSARGLTVDGPARTGTRLNFSGTVAQIEAAFGTELHLYDVNGARHFALSQAPSVPSNLADLVFGVRGLNDFRPTAPHHPVPQSQSQSQPQPQYAFPIEIDGGTIDVPALAPADFAAIYDLNPLYAAKITGAGQKIAVAEETDFNDVDLSTFRSTFKLSVNPPVRVLVPNSGTAVVTNVDDLGEAELDAEWAGAVAPDATIEYVFTGNDSQNGVFDALIYAIEQASAPLVSISYGGACESGMAPSDAVYYEAMGDAAAMMGITVLAASGDTGAAGCDGQTELAARRGEFVGIPASIPSIVAVGGAQFQVDEADASTTYFDTNLNALSYIPESGWNETATDEAVDAGGLGASTGGVSVIFAKPYWQILFTPKDKFRDVPDVALSASAAIMPYITSGSWTAADGTSSPVQAEALTPVGGTSCAAPSFAGILALVNQALAKANPSLPVGLGNANPVLYALANNMATKAAFHDITTGNNIVPCQAGSTDCPATPPLQFGYSAGPGYDQVTGLGTVDAAQLVNAWTALTPTSTTLQVTASGMSEGATLQLDATVASMATANGLTGSVTFYYETFDAMGNIDLGGTLGSVAVTPSTAGNEGGTASLKATAPSGVVGSAKIGAFYGGDINYLASWSALDAVTTKPTLAICPAAITLTPGQTGLVFQTSGGAPPVTLSITSDTTCTHVNHQRHCSSFDDAGVFTAGPQAGTATITAIDQAEAYVSATVTVAGSEDSGAPLPTFSCGDDDAGASDAGVDGAGLGVADAAVVSDAAGSGDAAASGKAPSSSGGCGCVAAGSGGAAGAGWSGILVGLVAFGARRRRQQGR